MYAVLAWVIGRIRSGDKPDLWGNMTAAAREQFRRAFRDAIWIPGFILSLAFLIDVLGTLVSPTYKFGNGNVYGIAVIAAFWLWLARQFVRFWWYQFRTRQKEIRIGKRFSIDLRERTPDPSDPVPLVRR